MKGRPAAIQRQPFCAMTNLFRLGLAAALVGVAGCNTSPHRSQFGEYGSSNLLLRSASGDTVTVFRVKRWTFDGGEPPAVQLEYALHGPVEDTAGIRRAARRIWPAFEPYVRAAKVQGAILTATHLIQRSGPVRTSQNQSFGMIALRGSDGLWRFQGDSIALPGGDTSGTPRIYVPGGDPLPFSVVAP
jgi:hypothetical protein